MLLSAAIYVLARLNRLPDGAARAYIPETTQEAAVEEEELDG